MQKTKNPKTRSLIYEPQKLEWWHLIQFDRKFVNVRGPFHELLPMAWELDEKRMSALYKAHNFSRKLIEIEKFRFVIAILKILIFYLLKSAFFKEAAK